jgi:hypothetical protein
MIMGQGGKNEVKEFSGMWRLKPDSDLVASRTASIAFIVGLAPLVWAHGASEIARRSVSTPVFVGMLAASTVGILLIPMLYVAFRTLREWRQRKPQGQPTPHAQPAE